MKLENSISSVLAMGTLLLNLTRNRATAFSTVASTMTRGGLRARAVSPSIRYATIPQTEESVATDRDVQSPASSTTGNQVLGKFPFGKTISNKHEVFEKVDKALGVDKPPDIEVILTDHSEFLYLLAKS